MRTLLLFLLIILPCLISAMYGRPFGRRLRSRRRDYYSHGPSYHGDYGRRRSRGGRRRNGFFNRRDYGDAGDTYYRSRNGRVHQVEGYEIKEDRYGRPQMVANLEKPDTPDLSVVVGGRRGRGRNYVRYNY